MVASCRIKGPTAWLQGFHENNGEYIVNQEGPLLEERKDAFHAAESGFHAFPALAPRSGGSTGYSLLGQGAGWRLRIPMRFSKEKSGFRP